MKMKRAYAVDSVEDMARLASGAANAEGAHVVVEQHWPLALPWSGADALAALAASNDNGRTMVAVRRGWLYPEAVAFNEADVFGQGAAPTQQMLLFGGCSGEGMEYHVLDMFTGELGLAVLMSGHGRRHMFRDHGRLTQREALSWWISGYICWAEEYPGLMKNRYALIEPETKS